MGLAPRRILSPCPGLQQGSTVSAFPRIHKGFGTPTEASGTPRKPPSWCLIGDRMGRLATLGKWHCNGPGMWV